MPKPPFAPSPGDIVDIFRNSLIYEIMYAFGVPESYDPTDYFQWETVNFARMAHARLLYDFFEKPTAKREKDDVVSEDFGYSAQMIPIPVPDRERVNKDLMHLTYARLKHTPATKPWPDSYLGCLLAPTVGFMRQIKGQPSLFAGPINAALWTEILCILDSGKELRVRCVAEGKDMLYHVRGGDPLPGGLPRLTKPVNMARTTNYGNVTNTNI